LDPVLRIETSVNKLGSRWDKQEDLDILNWLTQTDYDTQQTDYLGKRQEGTGEWLVKSTEFQEWLKDKGQTLFCPGIPGAGKTILTSVVIGELASLFSKDESIGIAYVYCNFRQQHEQREEDLLGSLLKQLSRNRPCLPEPVKSLYKTHKDSLVKPSVSEISGALQLVAAMYQRVFIVIDALDECLSSNGCREQFLSKIFDLRDTTKANVFATSRPDEEIMARFQKSMSLEIRAVDEDVQAYLSSRICQLPSFVKRNPELQDRIKTTIVKEVDGMYVECSSGLSFTIY
jgi:hypothetical protein